VVKPAQLQRSGFLCGKTHYNGSVAGRHRAWNRPGDLEPLLILDDCGCLSQRIPGIIHETDTNTEVMLYS